MPRHQSMNGWLHRVKSLLKLIVWIRTHTCSYKGGAVASAAKLIVTFRPPRGGSVGKCPGGPAILMGPGRYPNQLNPEKLLFDYDKFEN